MADQAPSRSELDALAGLLDDPDPAVQSSVRARMHELGNAAVRPALVRFRASVEGGMRAAVDELLRSLHLEEVCADWNTVMEATEPDLEEGAFVLARYRYPDLEVAAYRNALDGFAEKAGPYVERERGHKRALVLARFMHEVLGFDGNRTQYFDPENSYLNRVIDRRTGIPISLSVVYLLLGWRLGLPIYGVDMPTHFLAKYRDEHIQVLIDVFDRGLPVRQADVVRMLAKARIAARPVHFTSAGHRDILLRMVRNLLLIAARRNDRPTAEDLERLIRPWEQRLG